MGEGGWWKIDSGKALDKTPQKRLGGHGHLCICLAGDRHWTVDFVTKFIEQATFATHSGFWEKALSSWSPLSHRHSAPPPPPRISLSFPSSLGRQRTEQSARSSPQKPLPMWLGEGKQLQDGSRGSQVVGIGGKDPERLTAFSSQRTMEVGERF